MVAIERQPEAASRQRYDLIVVGAGIHGVMVGLEAGRRGLRTLLLDQGDFGSATTANSLRIIHGGLRYLQTADLRRYRGSVRERSWFLTHLPEHVRLLPCLMPLYGRGTRRPSIMACALALNEALSLGRNRGLRPDRRLARSRVVSAGETRRIFADVDTVGLCGGAVWNDAFMPSVSRVVMEILRWACARGAVALNYVAATELRLKRGAVVGVRGQDAVSGDEFEYAAPVVVNATGPWSRGFAAGAGCDLPELFQPTLAWNLLLGRPSLSDHALAVASREAGAQTFFLVPWKGVTLAGTVHSPWPQGAGDPRPSPAAIEAFLQELNRAIPGLALAEKDVVRVFAGLLPGRGAGSAEISTRDVIVDHGESSGPRGFFSVSGVKFTTSRRVAEKLLSRIFPTTPAVDWSAMPRPGSPQDAPPAWEESFDWAPESGEASWLEALRLSVAEEAVVHLDDLLLRRSDLGDDPERALHLAPMACELFDWDEAQRRDEIHRLADALGRRASG
jgi:glycerol-3-phosphate dehydrogenase